MRHLALFLGLLLLGAAAAPDPVCAQPYRAREGVQSGQVRSLDQILNGIRRERPGNLADVEGPNFGPGGEARYRLKWVSPDGRVQWLDTDARTGRVLGVQGDSPRGGPPRPGSGFVPRGGAVPRGGFDPRQQDFVQPRPGPVGPPTAGQGFRRGGNVPGGGVGRRFQGGPGPEFDRPRGGAPRGGAGPRGGSRRFGR